MNRWRDLKALECQVWDNFWGQGYMGCGMAVYKVVKSLEKGKV